MDLSMPAGTPAPPPRPLVAARPDPLASALHAALTQPEPQLPQCYLCGSTTGPWLPDPSAALLPSGAPTLIRAPPPPSSCAPRGARACPPAASSSGPPVSTARPSGVPQPACEPWPTSRPAPPGTPSPPCATWPHCVPGASPDTSAETTRRSAS